jgi:hypothetical protein
VEYRIDKANLSNVKFDNGMLTAKVNLTKAGVYQYLYSDGRVVKEAKLPEEIFSQATIDSANGAVITDNHPDINQDSGLVNSSNYSKLVKGNVFNVKQDGLFLSGLEKVFDSDLQKRILSGEQIQVSIGFEQRTDWTPGEYNGEKYDCIQRDIRINHIAHVEKGRAGEECRTILDSNKDYAIMQEANINMTPKSNTITWRVDNKDYSIDKSIIDKAVLSTVKKDADEPVAVVENPVVEPTATESPATPDISVDMNAITEKMKVADKIIGDIKNKYGIELPELMSLLEAKDEMIELYKSKMVGGSPEVMDAINVIRTAEAILPETKLDYSNLNEIKKQVIKAKLPNYKSGKFDSMTDSEIEVGYKAAVEVANHLAVFGKSVVTAKQDESKIDSLRAEVENAKNNYYKRGLK